MSVRRLLQANLRRSNPRLDDALALIVRLDPDIANLNEAITAVPRIRRHRLRKRFRLIVAKVRSRGGWDTAILVQSVRNEVQGWRAKRETKAAAPSKWAPARFTTSVRLEDEEGRQWRHFNVHLNAVIQSKRTWRPLLQFARTVQAGIQMASLEVQIRAAQRRGRLVSVAADCNWRDLRGRADDDNWRWSPQAVFTRCGLAWESHGPDYIAYPASWRVADRQTFDQDETGSDHVWLQLDIEPERDPKENP